MPNIFGIKTSFLMQHFLPIQTHGCKFGHSLISKLYPTFSKTYFFISSFSNSIFSGPLVLGKKIDSFDSISNQQFSNVIRFHIWWYFGYIANSLIRKPIFIVVNIFFILLLHNIISLNILSRNILVIIIS